MNRIYLLLAVLAALGSAVLSEDDDDSTKCPNNLPFTSDIKLFHGTCYQFVAQEKYWQQARDYCLLNGGRLAKINDPQTNQFIVESLNSLWWRNNGVWIGLHDITSEMEWQWTGYELYTNEPVLWTNWGRGHPGAFLHSRRDCVRMVRGGGDWRWHETLCSTARWHYRFICEYKSNVTRSVASGNQLLSRRPSPVNHQLPDSDSSVHEGYDAHAEMRAVADVQSSEQKTVGGDDKMKRSGIIAVALGCLLIGTTVIVIAFVLYRRRQKLHRYAEEDEEDSFSKGKDALDDDATPEESKSGRPRAVANIYVAADTNGHVTTRLASSPKPDVNSDSDEEYDEYDYDVELRQDSELEIPAKNGEMNETTLENDKPKSSNIYSEIPGGDEYPDNSHIYEALDEVKQ